MKSFFNTLLYKPLYNFLIWLTWLIPGHSMMFSIIVLTIIIRVLLLPTSLKAARLQVKNLQLQPKINKIRSEIKDQKEQSQALMNLYKEEGVSPFGSCLPLLIQLPILIILLQVFRNGLTSVNVADLYSFTPHSITINQLLFGFDLGRLNAWILPIIAGLSQFALSWMMMPPQPKVEGEKADPMAMMNRQMVFLLPITTVLIGLKMPAGLLVYWIVTTVFSIAQQYYVNKEILGKKTNDKGLKTNDSSVIEIQNSSNISKSSNDSKPSKSDMMTKMMSKRLDKQERKAGVNVTVRSKKK